LRGKSELEKKVTVVPGPGNYSPDSRKVEAAIAHAFTFGSRSGSVDAAKSKSSSKILPPGPGNYDLGSTFDKKAPVFGTEQRANIEGKQKVKNPGPGAYEPVNAVGKNKAPNYP